MVRCDRYRITRRFDDLPLIAPLSAGFSGGSVIPADQVLWQSLKGIPPDIWDKKGITIPLSDGEYWRLIYDLLRAEGMINALEEWYVDPFEGIAIIFMEFKKCLWRLEEDNECIGRLLLRYKVVELDVMERRCVEKVIERCDLSSVIELVLGVDKRAKELSKRTIREIMELTVECAAAKIMSGYKPWLGLREDGLLYIILLDESITLKSLSKSS